MNLYNFEVSISASGRNRKKHVTLTAADECEAVAKLGEWEWATKGRVVGHAILSVRPVQEYEPHVGKRPVVKIKRTGKKNGKKK